MKIVFSRIFSEISWNQFFSYILIIFTKYFQVIVLWTLFAEPQCGEIFFGDSKFFVWSSMCTAQCEKQEILSHQKIFREINSLVTSLVKPLISRNFCQNAWERIKLNKIGFTKLLRLISQCGRIGKMRFLFTFIWKMFCD